MDQAVAPRERLYLLMPGWFLPLPEWFVPVMTLVLGFGLGLAKDLLGSSRQIAFEKWKYKREELKEAIAALHQFGYEAMRAYDGRDYDFFASLRFRLSLNKAAESVVFGWECLESHFERLDATGRELSEAVVEAEGHGDPVLNAHFERLMEQLNTLRRAIDAEIERL